METRVFNLIIVDESGSMSCIEKQALTGLNETLQTIRTAQEKHPEMEQLVTLVSFNTESVKTHRDKCSIRSISDLKAKEYTPNGGTPLYDAIGESVLALKPHVTVTDTVLVTIITDGYENASHIFNAHSISELIDSMKECGWLFTYIGANQDAIAVARTMNIHNAMNFKQDEEGTRAMFEAECCSRTAHIEDSFRNIRKFYGDESCASMSEAEREEGIRGALKKLASKTDYFKKK